MFRIVILLFDYNLTRTKKLKGFQEKSIKMNFMRIYKTPRYSEYIIIDK